MITGMYFVSLGIVVAVLVVGIIFCARDWWQ